ncbi:hypothetical protein D9757_002038 [Collybiopsis confluens]|uniref:Telomere length regulation protein conserved domain-containing protein n=1 Tax=Collybiopsis confluens TaxID=2823264 RepID=A0A8H5HXX5_9AGAR|nr:hypothetical protein D9757_002038 [Collybiopsis confluens]
MVDSDSEVRELIRQLEHPISDYDSLLALLSAPLDCLALLPPAFRRYNANPLPSASIRPFAHIPILQTALLQHVLPSWDSELRENHGLSLLDQYFCPDAFSFSSPAAGDLALIAYSTILSLPLTDHSLRLLSRLSREYPIDRLHTSVFSQKTSIEKRHQTWEDCVQDVVSVPAKVGNYCGVRKIDVPLLLQHGNYFNNLSLRCEHMILVLALGKQPSESSACYIDCLLSVLESLPSVNFLLTKLVKFGLFTPYTAHLQSRPSFFHTTLPVIRSRVSAHRPESYPTSWQQVFRGIDSDFTLRHMLVSLFSCLQKPDTATDDSALTRAFVKRESLLLCSLCPLSKDDTEIWQTISAVVLGHDWIESMSRVFVCWLANCDISLTVLTSLLNDTVSLWSNPDHIRHSLISKHRLILDSRCVLDHAINNFLPTDIVFGADLAVAEVAAQRAGKSLDFKNWNGDDSGKPWARAFRMLILNRDLDADLSLIDQQLPSLESKPLPTGESVEPSKLTLSLNATGYDSDDSVTGYLSDSSSHSNSPTPSELSQIEQDPSLNVGRKKMTRPIYLAQLGAMIRSIGGMAKDDAAEEADRIEVALNCAEALIRKKKNYGTELEENAINLAYGLVGLQDNYDLDNFKELRQNALNALVACCPRKASLCIIEEFFKNQYSTDQRNTMLNALALGARELAALPIPSSGTSQISASFPSKRLPAPLHQRYLSPSSVLPEILSGITRLAIDRGKEVAEEQVPAIVRERRFRIQKPKLISEASSPPAHTLLPSKQTTFNEVAAEFFLSPLIHRFWLFLRDERTREERTSHQEGRATYHGAGTGLILNAMVMTQFLRTLSILVHASEHAPEWLGFIAPDALELALTLGTKPMSVAEGADDSSNLDSAEVKEASVLASSLELALVVLDGCIQLDGGRSFSLDHAALLMGVREWSTVVFSRLEDGIRFRGGGGDQKVSLQRAVSGVILKVDEILSRYRRAMIDTW